jgi:hypothetical protein
MTPKFTGYTFLIAQAMSGDGVSKSRIHIKNKGGVSDGLPGKFRGKDTKFQFATGEIR